MVATRAELAATGSFTAERVAARAEVSVATFYAHFPSKDDALVAAFSASLEDLLRCSAEALSVERLLEIGLAETVDVLVRSVVAFFRAEALVFRAALARLPDHRGIRDAYRETERRSLESTRRFVERGQAAGVVCAGDPEQLAELVMVFSQGLNNPRLLRLGDAHPMLGQLSTMLHGALAPR